MSRRAYVPSISFSFCFTEAIEGGDQRMRRRSRWWCGSAAAAAPPSGKPFRPGHPTGFIATEGGQRSSPSMLTGRTPGQNDHGRNDPSQRAQIPSSSLGKNGMSPTSSRTAMKSNSIRVKARSVGLTRAVELMIAAPCSVNSYRTIQVSRGGVRSTIPWPASILNVIRARPSPEAVSAAGKGLL
jgi:hypothetical protein